MKLNTLINKTYTLSYDDAMVELLKDDPEFMQVYLHQTLIELNEEGGYEAVIMALRQFIEATGGVSINACFYG